MRQGFPPRVRFRAFYPEVRIQVDTYQEVDSRLSFGHVVEPGVYATTVTEPKLFHDYLHEQISLLLNNHQVPIWIGESNEPIPLRSEEHTSELQSCGHLVCRLLLEKKQNQTI